jgi:hypothetical protein
MLRPAAWFSGGNCNGDALAELELLNDDNASAKMISGYMYIQFPLSRLPSPLKGPSSLSTFLRKLA